MAQADSLEGEPNVESCHAVSGTVPVTVSPGSAPAVVAGGGASLAAAPYASASAIPTTFAAAAPAPDLAPGYVIVGGVNPFLATTAPVTGGGPMAAPDAGTGLPAWFTPAYAASLPPGVAVNLGTIGVPASAGSQATTGYVLVGGGDNWFEEMLANANAARANQAANANANANSTARSSGATVGSGSAAAATSVAGGGDSEPTEEREESSNTRGGSRKFTPQSVHMTQFRNAKYNPDGPSRSGNCGIVATVMALRLAGLDVPGFNGQKTDDAIDKARIIATGENNISDGTTTAQQRKLAEAGGAKVTMTGDFDKALEWVRSGAPVVMSGNMADAWGKRYSHSQISNFDGRHSVTVSGYNEQNGKYIVNDPLSRIGAIEVSKSELKSYFSYPGTGTAMKVEKK